MSRLPLESLEIRNFRAFEHLRIEKLGRVNLVVGTNSVGKTSLLEAVWLYAGWGDDRITQRILELRDELFRPTVHADQQDEVEGSLRFLFHGRNSLEDGRQACTIGPFDSEQDVLRISVPLISRSEKEENITFYQIVDDSATWSLFPHLEVRELGYRVELGDKHLMLIPLRQFNVGIRIRRENQGIYIGADGLRRNDITSYWDNIALTGLEEKVVDALRIIVPELERIDLLYDIDDVSQGRVRIPVTRLVGNKNRLPLRSLGDGMSRLFGIAVALVNAKEKILLVDEIESGLHYTVLTDLWRLIFSTAKQLDMQVFATTHSWDCIEAFQAAAHEDAESEGMVIRLDRRDSRIEPVTYDERRLGIATREQIEVR